MLRCCKMAVLRQRESKVCNCTQKSNTDMLKVCDCTQKTNTDMLKVCDCTQKTNTDMLKVCDCTQKANTDLLKVCEGTPKKPKMDALPPNRCAKSVRLYPKNPKNPKFHTTICHIMCVSCITRSIVV